MHFFIDPTRLKLCAFDNPESAPEHFVQPSSERPSPHHVPVIENGKHAGWRVPDLNAVRALQVAKINGRYNQMAMPILEKYPEAEQKTFDIQRNEADNYLAWVADGRQGTEPDTRCLSRILEGRNSMGAADTMEDLAASVIENSDQLLSLQVATGVRQALVKKIEGAETYDEIISAEWPEDY